MFFLNPVFIYSSIWLAVIYLYSFYLSNILEPLNSYTITLVVGTSIGVFLGWMMESLFYKGCFAKFSLNKNNFREYIQRSYISKRLKFLWILLCIGIFFEIFYFNGAPGLGLIGIGPEIIYTDYGIPGLHGVLNSIFYACCLIQFTKLLLGLSKSYIPLLIISLIYPIVGMSRQVLISLLIQYFFVYISIKPLSFRNIIMLFGMASLSFLVFGYLGDIRSGRDNIISLSQPSFNYPEWLPSAFIWVYLYITTPLNNVNHNIDISPNYFPWETIGTLIPSFVRGEFMSLMGARNNEWELVTNSFNVSSLLQAFIIDFGILGSIIFSLFFGCFCGYLLRKSKNSLGAFFTLIVILHGISLSFFANLLFHLVFIFEIFILLWVVSSD